MFQSKRYTRKQRMCCLGFVHLVRPHLLLLFQCHLILICCSMTAGQRGLVAHSSVLCKLWALRTLSKVLIMKPCCQKTEIYFLSKTKWDWRRQNAEMLIGGHSSTSVHFAQLTIYIVNNHKVGIHWRLWVYGDIWRRKADPTDTGFQLLDYVFDLVCWMKPYLTFRNKLMPQHKAFPSASGTLIKLLYGRVCLNRLTS